MGLDPRFFNEYDRQMQWINPSPRPWIDPLTEAKSEAERIMITGRQIGKTKLMYETMAKHLGLNYDEFVRDAMEQIERERVLQGRDQQQADGATQDREAREPDGAGRVGSDVPEGEHPKLGTGRADRARNLGRPVRPILQRRVPAPALGWTMSRQSIAWGFLACGFLAPGVGAAWGTDAAFSAGALSAAAWCLVLALAQWTPPTGGDE
jgi:hypothetical protein